MHKALKPAKKRHSAACISTGEPRLLQPDWLGESPSVLSRAWPLCLEAQMAFLGRLTCPYPPSRIPGATVFWKPRWTAGLPRQVLSWAGDTLPFRPVHTPLPGWGKASSEVAGWKRPGPPSHLALRRPGSSDTRAGSSSVSSWLCELGHKADTHPVASVSSSVRMKSPPCTETGKIARLALHLHEGALS